MSFEMTFTCDDGGPHLIESFLPEPSFEVISVCFTDTRIQQLWDHWIELGRMHVSVKTTDPTLFAAPANQPSNFVYQTKLGTYVRRERLQCLCDTLGMSTHGQVAHVLTAMTSFGISRHTPPDYFAKIAPTRETDINLAMLLWASENPLFQQDVYTCYGAGDRNYRHLALFVSRLRESGIVQPSS